jgi:hypothetical protein
MSAVPSVLESSRTAASKPQVSAVAASFGKFVCDHTLEQEDPQEYAELLAGYIAQYCPDGVLEYELVRQITSATHRLRRIDRIENAAMFSESIAHTRHEASVIMMERFTNITDLCARLGRARGQAERAFQRAYKDLEERRLNRLTQRTPPEAIEIESNVRFKPILQNKARSARAVANPPSPFPLDQQLSQISDQESAGVVRSVIDLGDLVAGDRHHDAALR